jgi:AcrR family transcriptional regulator
MSADARRAAILDAVVPLLIENGAAVTTAEMAAAAGIAEGTIFRVFPDKASLLHAAIQRTLDPEPIVAELAQIAPNPDLAAQLVGATSILERRFEGISALIGMLRSIPHDDKPHADVHRIAKESMAAIVEMLTQLLEPHRSRILIEPSQAAALLRGLIFTNANRLLSPEDRMSNEQLVAVLLNGIARANA